MDYQTDVGKPLSIADALKARQFKPITVEARSYRDSLIKEFFDNIDRERLGTTYQPLNRKIWAIRVNKNPYFKGQEGVTELEALLKRCREKGNYSKLFFWTLKQK